MSNMFIYIILLLHLCINMLVIIFILLFDF